MAMSPPSETHGPCSRATEAFMRVAPRLIDQLRRDEADEAGAALRSGGLRVVPPWWPKPAVHGCPRVSVDSHTPP